MEHSFNHWEKGGRRQDGGTRRTQHAERNPCSVFLVPFSASSFHRFSFLLFSVSAPEAHPPMADFLPYRVIHISMTPSCKAGFRVYSYRKLSTGFAIAAFTALKLIVTIAITNTTAAATRNIQTLMFTLYAKSCSHLFIA